MAALSRIIVEWLDGVQLEIISTISKGCGQSGVSIINDSIKITWESATEQKFGVPDLSFEIDSSELFLPIRLKEEVEYQVIFFIPRSPSECIRIQNESDHPEIWPFLDLRLKGFASILQPRFWQRREQNGAGTTVASFFNPRGHVGVVDFSLIDNKHHILVEVLSSKISYPEDYRALLDELAEEHIGLIYQIDAPSSIYLQGKASNQVDSATLLFHLRRLMEDRNVPESIETIIKNPLSQLEINCEVSELPFSGEIDYESLLADLSQLRVRPGGGLSGLFKGYTPLTLPVTTQSETRDTPENRYIKSFLENLQALLSNLEIKLIVGKKPVSLEQVRVWKQRVGEWLSEPIWRDVGSMTCFPANSQKLQRTTGYKDILSFDVQLKDALALPWKNLEELTENKVLGDVRPIHDLFEYWCFFVLRRILRELFGGETRPNALIERDGGLGLKLIRGVTSQLEFLYQLPKLHVEIFLYYNRNFDRNQCSSTADWEGSYSGLFHPDFSICVKKTDSVHWLHFDAKYKVNIEDWRKELSYNEQDGITNPQYSTRGSRFHQSDLHKMHCYRDAILGSRGSYILYPGLWVEGSADIFIRRGKGTQGIYNIPSVGAFALSPRGGYDHRDLLKQFIMDIVDNLARSSNYCEEYGLFQKSP